MPQELQDRVIEYCLKPLVDQPMVVEQVRGPVEYVQEAIVALHDMMSLLMVEHINDEEYYLQLERRICVFLTRFAILGEEIDREECSPILVRSFICLSILNLTGIVPQYGLICICFVVGEGFLPFAKPALMHMGSGSFGNIPQ